MAECKNKFKVTLRLLLIRHGLSSYNIEKRIQGRNDLSVLTPQGEEQALKTGRALSGLKINEIYSSPLKRAASTTEIISKELKDDIQPIFDDGLLEVELGEWSGLKINEIKELYPDEYKKWQQDPSQFEITDSSGLSRSPIKELRNQAKNFIDRIISNHSLNKDKTIIIVAHNAILRCIILILLGEPKNGFRRIKLDNASLSVINLIGIKESNYECQIECLNSTSHLNNKLTEKGIHSRVLLVRHGETDWNLQGRFQGQIDIPLNKNGKLQASAAGAFLSKEKIDKAYSSSLSRPLETAKIILQSNKELKVTIKEDLIEIGHGLWEGKLESEIEQEWSKLLKEWKESPNSVEMPEGETIQKVWKRSVICWNSICKELKDNETALVVAHDAVNKTILCNLLGLSPSDIWMVKQGNGGVSVIDISRDNGKPDVVTCLNLTSHLGSILDSTAKGAL